MANGLRYLLQYLISHRLQLIKFILVGFITFGIYFLTFYLFFELIGLDYRIAATLAYLLTICSHFLLNRFFTFGAAEQEVIHNLWKYMLMLLFNYVTLLSVIWTCVNSIKISPYFGVLLSTGLSMLMNFFIMKYFVFFEEE